MTDAKARVGSVLKGKWRLEKLLGLGGSAAVYQASHVNNGKRAKGFMKDARKHDEDVRRKAMLPCLGM